MREEGRGEERTRGEKTGEKVKNREERVRKKRRLHTWQVIAIVGVLHMHYCCYLLLHLIDHRLASRDVAQQLYRFFVILNKVGREFLCAWSAGVECNYLLLLPFFSSLHLSFTLLHPFFLILFSLSSSLSLLLILPLSSHRVLFLTLTANKPLANSSAVLFTRLSLFENTYEIA